MKTRSKTSFTNVKARALLGAFHTLSDERRAEVKITISRRWLDERSDFLPVEQITNTKWFADVLLNDLKKVFGDIATENDFEIPVRKEFVRTYQYMFPMLTMENVSPLALKAETQTTSEKVRQKDESKPIEKQKSPVVKVHSGNLKNFNDIQWSLAS